MTIWIPDLSLYAGPRYRALAQAIRQAIEQGGLVAGTKLPPMRDLAWRLGVTVGTVSRGYALATEQGLIAGEVGRGTYVREINLTPEDINQTESDKGVLYLERSVPAGLRAFTYLGRTLHEIAASSEQALPIMHEILNYGDPEGALRFREMGAKWLTRVGLDVPAERVILTGGAQQAISVVFGTVTSVGDRILVESLTYSALHRNAEARKLLLHGLAMDEEGVVPEALEAACQAGPARLLCLVPTLQNPTIATMSLARRQAIVALARKYDLLILEDDVYGFMPPDRPPPIASLAPERTFYVASASKCLAPGFRVGWLVAPEPFVEPAIGTLHMMSLALPVLPIHIVSRWIETGAAVELLAAQRQECVLRQEIAAKIFQGYQLRADPYCLHILLELPPPWRSADFVAAAAIKGVVLRASSDFAVKRDEAPASVRISIGAARNTTRLETGLRVLVDLLRTTPARRSAI